MARAKAPLTVLSVCCREHAGAPTRRYGATIGMPLPGCRHRQRPRARPGATPNELPERRDRTTLAAEIATAPIGMSLRVQQSGGELERVLAEAGAAVDELASGVEVSEVPGGLLNHVKHDEA